MSRHVAPQYLRNNWASILPPSSQPLSYGRSGMRMPREIRMGLMIKLARLVLASGVTLLIWGCSLVSLQRAIEIAEVEVPEPLRPESRRGGDRYCAHHSALRVLEPEFA